MVPERFVDAASAAEFLSLSPRRVLDMARAGTVPGHPFGIGGRKTWRFRLSELESSVCQSGTSPTFLTDSRASSRQQACTAARGDKVGKSTIPKREPPEGAAQERTGVGLSLLRRPRNRRQKG
jgi:hypothetical protein